MDIYPNLSNNKLEDERFDKEINETIKNLDVINETVAWFDRAIDSTKEIDGIWADSKTSPEDVKIQILAKKELRAMLICKRNEFVSDVEIAKNYKEKHNEQ